LQLGREKDQPDLGEARMPRNVSSETATAPAKRSNQEHCALARKAPGPKWRSLDMTVWSKTFSN